MPDKPLIYTQLAAIMRDVEAIKKEKKNKEQGFQYRGIDDMYNELHNLFAKHNVVVMPQVTHQERLTLLTTTNKNIFYTILTVEFHFFAEDGSSTFSRIRGEGADMADKSSGKAHSNAMKYALMEVFLIPTEDLEDPDSTTPDSTKGKEKEPDKKEPPKKQPFSRELYDLTVAAAEEKAKGDAKVFAESMTAIWVKVEALYKNKEISDELYTELIFVHDGKIAGLI